MNRPLITIALSTAALALTTSGAWAAQDTGKTSPSAQQQGQKSGQRAQAPDPSSGYVASNLIGQDVKDRQGAEIGTLDNVIIDKSGKVTYGVLNQGGVLGIGGQSYAVPWDRFQISANNELRLNVLKDQVATEFSAFEPKEQMKPKDREEKMEREPSQPMQR